MRDERVVPVAARSPARDARRDVIPGVGLPKALFLLAAGMSFAMSVYLFLSGDPQRGIFVGLWVPSILSCGALLLGRDGDE